MKSRNIFALGLSVVAIASSAAPAAAIPYNSATVYRAMDGSNQVVVFSGTPGSRVQVDLGSTLRTTARLAGNCGEVRISPPASGSFDGLIVQDEAVNASSLPVQTLPSCVNGNFSEPRSGHFRTPNNQIVAVNFGPGSAVSVSLPNPVNRAISINSCGFGTLRGSSNSPLPATFKVGTTNYTVASLPNAGSPPYARTVNGTPYCYVPVSW